MERERAGRVSEADEQNERKRFVYVYRENWNKFMDGEQRVNLISLSFAPRKRKVIEYRLGEHKAELRYGNLDEHFKDIIFYQQSMESPPMVFSEEREVQISGKVPRRLSQYNGRQLHVVTTIYPLVKHSTGEKRTVSKERYFLSKKSKSPIAEVWTAERFDTPAFVEYIHPSEENSEPIPNDRAVVPFVPKEPRMVQRRTRPN